MTNISPNPNLHTFAQMQNMQAASSTPAAFVPQNAVQTAPATPSASAPDLNTANTLEKTPKADTITIAGKTIKKKTAIIGGLSALAAAAAIGAAIVFRARSGKTPVIPPATTTPETAPAAEVIEAVSGKAGEVIDGVQKEAQELADNIQKEAEELAKGVQKEAKDALDVAQKKLAELTEIFKNGGKDAEGNVVTELVERTENIGDKTFVSYEMQPNPDAGICSATFFKDGTLRSAHIAHDGADIYSKYGQDSRSCDDICYMAGNKRFSFDEDSKLFRYILYPEDSIMGTLEELRFDSHGKILEYANKHSMQGKGVSALFEDGKICMYSEGSQKALKLVDNKWIDATQA